MLLFFVEKDGSERRREKSYKKVTNRLKMLKKWGEDRESGEKD